MSSRSLNILLMRFTMAGALVCGGINISCKPTASPKEDSAPRQKLLADNIAWIAKQDWILQPLATFELEARVLSVRSYRSDNTPAGELAPFDLALGWGPMADEAILKRLEITQRDRQYFWQWWGAAPLSEAELVRTSTNAHLIPANDSIAAIIASLQPGQWLRMQGLLVEARHPQLAQPWVSSLTREDQGEGACEIILVQSLQHISGRSGNL